MAFSVDGPVQLYTLLFGWQQFNNLWLILTQSGIAFLPFAGVVIQAFIGAASSQIDLSTSLLMMRRMETKIISMFFVIIIAAQPSVTLKLNEMSFTSPCRDGKPISEIIPAGDDQSDFRKVQMVDFIQEVKVPPWWFAVMSLSTGFTQAAKFALPCAIDNLQKPEVFVIPDEHSFETTELADEVKQFIKQCYQPALAKYNQLTLTGDQFEKIQEIKSSMSESNVYTFEYEWFGSDIFLRDIFLGQDYYAKMLSRRPEGGQTNVVTCKDWYLGQNNNDPLALRNKLKTQRVNACIKEYEEIIFADDVVFQQALAPLSAFTHITTQRELSEYICLRNHHKLAKKALFDTALIETLNDSVLVDKDKNEESSGFVGLVGDFFNALYDGAVEFSRILSSMFERLKSSVVASVLAQFAPIALSFIISAVITILPVGIVFSSYSLQFMMTASAALFALIFTHYLFHLVIWIQNVLFLALSHAGFSSPTADSLLGVATSISFTNNAIMTVSNSLYLLFPLMATSVMTWAQLRVGLDIDALLTRLTAPAQAALERGGSIIRFGINTLLGKIKFIGAFIRI